MKSPCLDMRLALIIFGFLLSMPAFGQGQKGNATAIEIAMLPKFCLSEYLDNLPAGPEYRIEGCGVTTNHYCWGLVKLNRAKKAKTKNEKRQNLERARVDTFYTLNSMKDYPACAIRPHVDATLAQIEGMLRAIK